MNDDMTDSMWFGANPTRTYRIRRRDDVDSLGLVAAIVVRIAADDRRVWSMRNIRMRDDLPDTDEAAALALQEHEFIFAAKLGRVHGHPGSISALVDNLRRDAAGIE